VEGKNKHWQQQVQAHIGKLESVLLSEQYRSWEPVFLNQELSNASLLRKEFPGLSDAERRSLGGFPALWHSNPEKDYENARKLFRELSAKSPIPHSSKSTSMTTRKKTSRQTIQKDSSQSKRSLFWNPISGLIAAGVIGAITVALFFQNQPSERSAPVNVANDARVLFVTGQVSVSQDGQHWKRLRIGELLKNGMVVRTGQQGHCDIQIGKESVFRMKEESELKLAELFKSKETGNTRTGLELVIGKVLVKPKELKDGESFQVRTPTAVAGVRGTRFSVESTPGKDTKIGVLHGKVTLRKRIPSLERTDRELIASSKYLSNLDKKLKEETVIVQANESVQVTAKDVDKVNRQVEQVVELVKDVREKMDIAGNSQQGTDLQKSVDDVLSQKVQIQSLQNGTVALAEIKKAETLQGNQKQELQDFSKNVQQLDKIQEQATLVLQLENPVDATIFMDNQKISDSSSERVLSANVNHTIRVVRDGFITKEFLVNLKQGERRVFAVNLMPEKRDLPRLQWERVVSGQLQGSPWYEKEFVYIASATGDLICMDRKGNEIWKYSTNSVVQSSPIVYKDTVYLGNSQGMMYALRASDGKLLWKRALGAIVYGNRPAFFDHQMILGTAKGDVVSVDVVTGKATWVFKAQSGIYTTPVIYKNRVFIGSEDRNLYSLDVQSGKKVWSFRTGRRIIQSKPAIAKGVVYIGSLDQHLYAIDMDTGLLKWSFAAGGMIFASPIVSENKLYLGVANGSVFALDRDQGKMLWRANSGGRIQGDMLVAQGFVLVGVQNIVKAFHAETGLLAWQYEINGNSGTGLAISGNDIYAISHKGTMYSLRVKIK